MGFWQDFSLGPFACEHIPVVADDINAAFLFLVASKSLSVSVVTSLLPRCLLEYARDPPRDSGLDAFCLEGSRITTGDDEDENMVCSRVDFDKQMEAEEDVSHSGFVSINDALSPN